MNPRAAYVLKIVGLSLALFAIVAVLAVAAAYSAEAAPIKTKAHCSAVGDTGARECTTIRHRIVKQHPRVRSIRACLSGADFADPAADRGRMWVTTKWGVVKWRRDNLTYPNDGGAICIRRWVGGVDAGKHPRVLVSGRALLADGTRVTWAQWTVLP